MSFSYLLATSIGKVRLLIPDNDSTAFDLEDDEITYFLGQAGSSVNGAAVKACMWLARKYAKKASFSADGLSIQHGQRATIFAERAKELQAESDGYMAAVTLEKQDGYSEKAGASEYETPHRIIYIDTD
jgi:hypothetical protein